MFQLKKKLNADIVFSANFNKKETLRTLAISKDNFDYLKKNNKKLNFSAWPTEKIKIFTEKKKSKELFEFTNKKKNNFYLVKYKEIYDDLLKNLKKNNYVKFVKTNTIPKDHFFSKKKYNLIINSDLNSYFTKKYFSKKIEKNYNSIAYTTIIDHKKLKNNTAVQIFTKIGPIAFLPLSNKETSVVFSYDGKKKLKKKQIIELIKKFNINYKLLYFRKIEKFNLKFSMLRNYYHDNILSFGDLLHKIHPLAGQGFNMTIRDIKILSKLIDENISLGMDIDSSINLKFQNKTKHLNYVYGSGIDLIYKFFKLDNNFDNFLSEPIFKLLKKRNFFNKYANYFSDKGINF